MASSGSGGMQKGKAYERKVAKYLSNWWKPFKFSRVPQSGAYRGANESEFAGDIATEPASRFPFVVECKHREGGWTLESVLLNKLDVRNWWAQCVGDARRVKRSPLLIFTRNYADDFVMIPYREDVYEEIVQRKDPVMRTVVTYKDEVTLVEESFDVLVTTIGGLTKFSKDYLIDRYSGDGWEAATLIEYETSSQEEEKDLGEEIGSLLDKVRNL